MVLYGVRLPLVDIVIPTYRYSVSDILALSILSELVTFTPHQVKII